MGNNKSQVLASSAGKVALYGILGAQALALSFFESYIPQIPGLPPGAKLGFSNIVTMYAVYSMGLPSAIYITLLKAGFAFLTRGATAGFMSLSGGILSTLIMFLLVKFKSKPFGIAGIGILSAIAHNMGQLIVAIIMAGSLSVLSYAPLLLIFSVITGLVTGSILKIIIPALEKQSKFFINIGKKN